MLFSSDAMKRSVRSDDTKASGKTVDALTADALDIVKQGFDQLTLQTLQIRHHTAYRVQSVPHLLVLRRLNLALRLVTRVRPSDRDTVIRCLATVLAEGVNHRVYKFDIKSFFESVDTDELYESIAADQHLPRRATLLLFSYFEKMKKLGVKGLPRGVPLSATLAEYAMQGFDRYISTLPETYYFARYVDDIVIITGARESSTEFTQRIRRQLPSSLSFNTTKTQILEVGIQKRSTGAAQIGDFNYLGYKIAIHETAKDGNKHLVRRVSLAIAPNKVRRLKSRICSAIVQFIANRDFKTLTRRLQLLTGNYNIRDFSTGSVRNAGLFCNYRRVNQEDELQELDSFLRSLILGNRSGISQRFSRAVTPEQRRSLLTFSFKKSFSEKIFYNFPPKELSMLTGCWRNV